MKKIFYAFVFMLLFLVPSFAQAQKTIHTGVIRGQVLDAEVKTPLISTNISIQNTLMGASSDADGNFEIKNVPVGTWSLRFSYIGYETVVKTDVIVKSNRITTVNAELTMSSVVLEGVVVTGGYFSETKDEPVSAVNFSSEEIRRAPGSAGDVSRILMSLPSIAKVNDQTNNLIVRGGSPTENAFYVDNIEIPNINHFPTQGASGGPIGLLNVDFIEDVRFYSGGFSSKYGDRLSSIMDITFRQGNRNEFDGQLDLNFAGFGGTGEGPLFNKKGSWLLSARKSYLDYLVDMIDIGTSVAPVYGDIQGKIVYDLNSNHQLMLLGIWGDDHNNPGRDTAIENDMIYYGKQDIYERTTGINWRALWNKNGYSNTSLSVTSQDFNENNFETNSGLFLSQNNSSEYSYNFRQVNHFRINNRSSVEFGLDAKYLKNKYNNYFAEYTDALGNPVSSFRINQTDDSYKTGIFLDLSLSPVQRLNTTLGVRTDYFSMTEKTHIAPRFSFSYALSNRTSVTGAAGIYYQALPMVLLIQNEENKNLKETQARHLILGSSHLLTENTRLTLEVYHKEYKNFPMDPAQPGLFLIDELYYQYGFFMQHEQLVDTGRGYSRGIELVLQKKLARDVYGLVSASWFRTKYQDLNNIWRNRVFDNQILLSMEGGYKPNNKWEFSARWIFAGGAPYTPFDISASKELARIVLDKDRINESRYPNYHSMNVRFDRRFHFNRTNIVTYFSVWNAYGRKNVASYFWNEKEKKQDTIYQWTMLPIFGIEYEF